MKTYLLLSLALEFLQYCICITLHYAYSAGTLIYNVVIGLQGKVKNAIQISSEMLLHGEPIWDNMADFISSLQSNDYEIIASCYYTQW